MQEHTRKDRGRSINAVVWVVCLIPTSKKIQKRQHRATASALVIPLKQLRMRLSNTRHTTERDDQMIENLNSQQLAAGE